MSDYTNIFLKDVNGNEVHPKTNFEQVVEPESGKTLAEVLEGLEVSGSGGSSLKSVTIQDTDPNNPDSEPGKYLVFEYELADETTSKIAVNLSDIVDLSDYATSEDLSALESALNDKFCIATITSDTGTSRIQNEITGSGPMYHHVDGTYSYTGVNNGGADGIGVQTYVKDNATGTGTRINVYTKGAYYVPNKSNTDADYVADDPDREIAVKGDLAALEARLAAVEELLMEAAFIGKTEEQSDNQSDEPQPDPAGE